MNIPWWLNPWRERQKWRDAWWRQRAELEVLTIDRADRDAEIAQLKAVDYRPTNYGKGFTL